MLELNREETLQLVQRLISTLANPTLKTISVPGFVKELREPAVVLQVAEQDPEKIRIGLACVKN